MTPWMGFALSQSGSSLPKSAFEVSLGPWRSLEETDKPQGRAANNAHQLSPAISHNCEIFS